MRRLVSPKPEDRLETAMAFFDLLSIALLEFRPGG